MIKALITGIDGFIGRSLRDHIEKRYPDWEVYGVDKKASETKKTFKLDMVQNQKELKHMLFKIKPNYIFHLAGTTVLQDFRRLCNLNVFATYTLLKSIWETKDSLPRIVIPSSASEYGRISESKMPIKENFPLNPVSLYGFSKMMQTEVSLLFSRLGLDIVIARIFNIVGPAVPANFSLGKFAYKLASLKKHKKRKIIYTKSLNSIRDFLDIRDVCNYLVMIALHGKRGEVYNICRGKPYLIRDLLDKLLVISCLKNIKVIERKHDAIDDISVSFGSVKKIRGLVKNFDPIPIEKSLRDTYFYYLSRV